MNGKPPKRAKSSLTSDSPSTSKSSPTSKLSAEALSRQLRAALALPDAAQNPVVALERSSVHSPLILLGKEHLRAKRIVEWLRANLFTADTSVSMYFGGELTSEASISRVRNSLTNMSLFCPAQAVVIYDADKIKAAPGRLMAEAVLRSKGSAFVVIAAQGMGVKGSFVAQVAAASTVVEFSDLDERSLLRWIEKEAARHSEGRNAIAGIEPEAAATLISCYGSDLSALAQEIAKLALLTGKGEKINKRLVQQISGKTPEATSFSLVQEIAKRNTANALVLTKHLIEQGLHPLQISAFLSRSMRTLIANADQGPNTALAPELTNSWFIKNLGGASRAYNMAELRSSLAVLSELDFQLKDSKLPDSLVLSNAVQRLAARNFSSPEPAY